MRDSSGLGMIIAIVMSAVLITIAVFLLEKIVPFARTVQGMENSLQAKYDASSWAEEALLMYYLQKNTQTQWWKKLMNNPYGNIFYNSGITIDAPDPEATPFFVKSLTQVTPLTFDSLSYGDADTWSWKNKPWNKLRPGQSIFLNVTGVEHANKLAQMVMHIRTPGSSIITPSSDDPMFLISLSGIETRFQQNKVLTLLPHDDISSGKSEWEVDLAHGYTWRTNHGDTMTPTDFFWNHVVCDGFCSIEISLIGDLGDAPYLEYNIAHETLVPDVHALLVSRGEKWAYAHTIYWRVPQKSFISGIGFATQ